MWKGLREGRPRAPGRERSHPACAQPRNLQRQVVRVCLRPLTPG